MRISTIAVQNGPAYPWLSISSRPNLHNLFHNIQPCQLFQHPIKNPKWQNTNQPHNPSLLSPPDNGGRFLLQQITHHSRCPLQRRHPTFSKGILTQRLLHHLTRRIIDRVLWKGRWLCLLLIFDQIGAHHTSLQIDNGTATEPTEDWLTIRPP